MRVALAALLPVLLMACDSRATTTPNADAGASDAATAGDTECAAWSSSWCAAITRCAPGLARARFESQDACAQRMTTDCVRSFFSAGTGITEENAQSCFAAYSSSECGAVVRALVEGTVPDACQRGTIAQGQACGSRLQCATGTCSVGADGCGTCDVPAPSARPCKVDSDCNASEVCDGVCKPRGEMGAACTSTSQCHAELACVSGVCGPRRALGQSCADDSDNPCAYAPQPLACDIATLKCAPVRFAATGDACDPHGTIVCGFPSICSGVGSAATCATTPDDGAACTDTCRTPASCWKGKCQIVDATACGAVPP